LLGFIAVAADPPSRNAPVADDQRLVKGPAFGAIAAPATAAGMEQWPTYRHDAARHGCTPATVAAEVEASWRVKLGGRLSAPVAVDGRVYVAACDAHTVHAVAMDTGKPLWKFIAGARIDSPPTIYKGMVLFGSCDGYVYCLRATDGELVWRFLAAPLDCRIACFDQLESVWPVHGSVLVRAGIAYVTAGRSTYLDGGIRLYGLDPRSGRIVHQTVLAGPLPDIKSDRDVAFYLTGANSDVLVSEGESIYMRQKRLTLELDEVPVPVLSSKGAQDVGLHVFSTASLLDSSWYNRTFWMYSKRWPGFQLANQAPKSGQLLVVGAEKTFAVRVFYRRNVHSPMFFPGKEGYLLFADRNGNEPQIVGERGAKQPVAWLPQSRIPRSGDWGLDSKAFGLDKMIGYTRSEPSLWQKWLPIRIRAMVKAGPVLFVAGPPDRLDPKDPTAALEGRDGARLAAVSTADGTELASCPLDVPPVFDGLIATDGRLFVSLEDGSLACLRESR
jgi:outer membrane protein assembly factor BamB